MSAVLGLCAFVHDSAAALLVDGDLVGFAEEERFSGIKHDKQYPAAAVEWLLDEAGLTAGQVDAVGYHFVPGLYRREAAASARFLLRPSTARRAVPRARSFAKVAHLSRGRLAQVADAFPRAAVRPVLHHRAHGLYAFAASGYEQAAVLVVDSLGEQQTTTIADARTTPAGLRYRIVRQLADPASLGYAYGAVTQHLGWRRADEEGTVMALAALGDPARFRALFEEGIPLTTHGFRLDPGLFPLRVVSSRYPRLSPRFVAATCPRRALWDEVGQVHADLAAALQERTETVLLHLARLAREATGARLLCLGGGVAMNCVGVGRIVATGLFDEVFVPPAPGDSGTAIGAALAVHGDRGGSVPTGVGRCYLGPSFEGIELAAEPRPGLSARRLPDPARHLAEQLAAGKIVGVFRGALEGGPRALGHRSILASPLLPQVVDRLNAKVKFREPFRPFAPVIPAGQVAEYFHAPQPSPHMSMAFPATGLARHAVPSVVHKNGTGRVQTLEGSSEPFLAEVLDVFAKITGHPVLILTSLNVKGQPMCGTPDMALACLEESGMDALLLEDWWVTRQ